MIANTVKKVMRVMDYHATERDYRIDFKQNKTTKRGSKLSMQYTRQYTFLSLKLQ